MSDLATGAAVLSALDTAGRLFATTAEAAAILGCDARTVRSALESGDIPHTRVGQRYQIPVAWLRRQADGVPAP